MAKPVSAPKIKIQNKYTHKHAADVPGVSAQMVRMVTDGPADA